uniref:Photosystem I assembly protein Ycf4 n=1 Tax=Lathyrus ochrus TaxID=3858 RepID=A0A7R6QUP4_LATOC|nr:photosystem I assembly protein Ycf4 [Lathyrus ochrus]
MKNSMEKRTLTLLNFYRVNKKAIYMDINVPVIKVNILLGALKNMVGFAVLSLWICVEKVIRRLSKNRGFRSYLSENAWIDRIPGSRNSTNIFFGYFHLLQSLWRVYRLVCNYYGRTFLAFMPVNWIFVPPDKRVWLLFYAIGSIALCLWCLVLIYCNLRSGFNLFDKKHLVVYITRYGFFGKGRCIVSQVPMKEIKCLILKTDPDRHDVLYMKTRKQGTLPLTPVKDSPVCNLRQNGVELSRFLSVRLIIVEPELRQIKKARIA